MCNFWKIGLLSWLGSGILACLFQFFGGQIGAGVVAGTVAFTTLEAGCPDGWSEYTPLRGRYVVGLPSAGTQAATVGTPLTNIEERVVGQHAHGASQTAHDHNISIKDSGHTHGVEGLVLLLAGTYQLAPGGNSGVSSGTTFSSTTGISASSDSRQPAVTVTNTGTVVGTPAPYIQLRACRKN